jgi:hypothetical protein
MPTNLPSTPYVPTVSTSAVVLIYAAVMVTMKRDALVSVAQTSGRIRCKTGFVRINGARIGKANSRELVS